MPSVEFRVNNGVLEYRCLVLYESDSGCLFVMNNTRYTRYTDWAAVPQVPNDK